MSKIKRYDGFIWSIIILAVPNLSSLFLHWIFQNLDVYVTLWILGNIVLAFLCVLYLKKYHLMELFRFDKPKVSKFAWMILAFFVLFLWTIVSSQIFPLSQNNQLLDQAALSSPYLARLIPFMVVLVAPIYEEISIRALPMQLLKPYARYGLDILIPSAIFACAHLHGLVLSDFISYFAPGIVYALLIRKTKSIYYSMGLHVMWNGFGYLVNFLSKIL